MRIYIYLLWCSTKKFKDERDGKASRTSKRGKGSMYPLAASASHVVHVAQGRSSATPLVQTHQGAVGRSHWLVRDSL